MKEQQTTGIFDVFKKEDKDEPQIGGKIADAVYSRSEETAPGFMIQRERLPEYLKYQKKHVMVLSPRAAVLFCALFIVGWFVAYLLGVSAGRERMRKSMEDWGRARRENLSALQPVSAHRVRDERDVETTVERYFVYFRLAGNDGARAERNVAALNRATGLEFKCNTRHEDGWTWYWIEKIDGQPIMTEAQIAEIEKKVRGFEMNGTPLVSANVPVQKRKVE